jgi:hypothetical protein
VQDNPVMVYGERSEMKVGANMQAVADYVAAHPGCSKLDAAKAITHSAAASATNHGQYESIDKAIRAGLIRAERHGNRYALYSR